MKKLFTLLTMLIVAISTSWADDTYVLTLDNGATEYVNGTKSTSLTYYSHGDGSDSQKFSFNTNYAGKYNGTEYAKGLKMEGSTFVQFTAGNAFDITVVRSTKKNSGKTIKFGLSGSEEALSFGDALSDDDNANVAVATLANQAAGTYKIIRGDGEAGIVYVSVTEHTASAATPGDITMSPDGGAVEGKSEITIASTNAQKIYYFWSDDATAPAQGDESYSVASGASYKFAVPNTSATKYLHAYAWNNYNTNSYSATATKTFTVTAVKEATGLAYATAALIKDITDASFTNTLTNPHNLAVTYSIAEGATATGVQVDENGLVTIGSVTGTATIKATYDGDDTYEAGEASYVLTVVNANRTATNNAYYVAVDDQFIPGATITGEDIVMTFDANSGAGFSKAVADNTLGFLNSNYVASMAGNNNTANGWKASFVPTKAGILSVGVVINNNKTFSITPDDNVASFTYNGVNAADPAERVSAVVTGNTLQTGSATSAKLYVLVTISVEANKTYKFSVAGSKMGFYGFEFKESGSTETVTTPAEGVATFVTPYALDFTGLATKAYIVTAVSNTSASTQAVTTVPAGTPLLVKGASVEVPIIASADAVEGNLLKVATAGGKVGAAGIYAYSKSAKQFRPVATTVTIPAGKCYLEISGNSGDAIDIDFDDAPTAVEAVQEVQEFNGSKVQKVIKNGQLFIGNYTVAGARVK